MQHDLHFRKITCVLALVWLLLAGLLLSTGVANAASNGELPARADIQSQLDALSKQKNLSAQDKLIQQDLTQTLETLDKIERVKQETTQLRQRVAQAPEKMRQATEALNALSTPESDDSLRQTFKAMSLRQLEARTRDRKSVV